jgi:D-amino-acid dehydrogenase
MPCRWHSRALNLDQRAALPNDAGMDNKKPRRAVVIGAGIVGMSTALYLQRDGHEVTVIDPGEPGQQTSFGNACSLSMSSVMPTAIPGLVKKLPGMLLDATGPLNVRWQYLPRLMPFLLALLRNTAPARLEKNANAIGQLMPHIMSAYTDLTNLTGTTSFIRRNGALKVYETDASFAAGQLERELLTRNDCEFDILGPDELGQLEPGLAPIFKHALFMPHSGAVTNPGRMIAQFAEFFVANGGTLVRDAATDVDLGEHRAVLTANGRYDTDIVALTAGPWSGPLAAKLGGSVRLEAERGYHIMLNHPNTTLNRFVLFADRKFVLTPHEDGLRLTSGVEYAKVDAPPDYRRIRGLLPQAAQVMKDVDTEEQSIWCGNRPTLPDSVPVIGPSPRYDDVFFGFGHSHLGLTMGPITGQIIADLAMDRTPPVDLAPYDVAR